MNKFCEYCGEEIGYKKLYGSGRFCSSHCARKFSSSSPNNSGNKTIICKKCFRKFDVDKHYSGNHICPECKKKKCPICGAVDCQNKLCKRHNIKRTINSLYKYFGLNINALGSSDIFIEIEKVKRELEYLYFDLNLSSVEISKIYECPNHIITDTFKQFDIKLRNSSDALLLAVMESRAHNNIEIRNQYKSQWHTSWNGKEFFLRSSYELDYAEELDKKRIDYDVEFLRIKYFDTQLNKYRCSIPDFYIPSTNTIVEIKSDYTLDVLNMKDKVKAYEESGYNFKLILEHREVDLYSL